MKLGDAARIVNTPRTRNFVEASSTMAIPSFDSIWPAMRIRNAEGIENMIHYQTGEDGQGGNTEHWGSFKKSTGKDANDHPVEFKAHVEEQVKYALKERYREIVNEYSKIEGKPCWREMTLSTKIDPTIHRVLGIHWSIQKEGAGAYNGKPLGRSVVYQAKIDMGIIDWLGTLLARLDPYLDEVEFEIRFKRGQQIYVYHVEDKVTHDISVINDWRKT